MDDRSPTGNTLLVPVRLYALAVTGPTLTSVAWRRGRLDFRRDFADPEPSPFDASRPGEGIHLHWHLPEALGRGRMDLRRGFDAPLDFPSAPNRWLVVRYHHTDSQNATSTPAVAGWMVHSDYRSDNKGPGPRATSPIGRGRWMGRKVDLSTTEWNEPTETYPKLTVMGPGLPTFAAFQPYCEDVFSLRDPMADAHGQTGRHPAGSVSYTVIGWHAAPADDPLQPVRAEELLEFFGDPDLHAGPAETEQHACAVLERLGWQLPGCTKLPGRSIYHGAVYGIPWNHQQGAFPPSGNRPTAPDDSVKLAVGHDAADAVAALVEDSLPRSPGDDDVRRRRAELTRAFHSGHLEAARHGLGTDGARRLLDLAAHEQWFTPTDGGHLWQLADRRDKPGDPLPPGKYRTFHRYLAQLNARQRGLDHMLRQVARVRRTVWDLWWLSGWYDELRPAQRPSTFTDRVKSQVDKQLQPDVHGSALQVLLAAEAETVTRTRRRDLAAHRLQSRLPDGWALEAVPRPPFHHAADPAVVLRGIGIPTATAEARQPPLRREQLLPCRLDGQAISSATVGNSPAPGTPTTFQAPAAPLVPGKYDPGTAPPAALVTAVKALLGELYVLHAVAHHRRKELKYGQPLNLNNQVTLGGTARWPPAACKWDQPWQPLHLAWRVRCYPLPHELPGSCTEPMWAFDGTRRTLRDDDKVRAEILKCGQLGFQAQGRALLSPLPVFTLQQRVDAYCRTFGNAEAFRRFRDMAGGWDLYSQSLTGLRAALAGRQPVRGRGKPLAQLTGTVPDAEWPDTDDTRRLRSFIQAGQVEFLDVAVIDTFGQAVTVISSVGNRHEGHRPRVAHSAKVAEGRTVTTTDWQRLWQLPPRLPQSARLCLTPLSHKSGRQSEDQIVDPVSDPRLLLDTPVCGWLAFRGYGGSDPLAGCRLTVRAPDGTPLGEVLRIGPRADRHAVGWRPLPGSPWLRAQDIFEPEFSLSYPQLAGFLHHLLDRDADDIACGRRSSATEKPKRLADLAAAINAGLAATSGRPPVQGVSAALAAGRPLALVRLRVHLELDGPPLTDPRWDAILNPPRKLEPCPDRRWPVRLGTSQDRTDGLIGYFAGDRSGARYDALYTDYRPKSPVSSYTRPIVAGATVHVPARPAAEQPNPADAAYVSLLADPFLGVDAHTDIQPVTRFRLPATGIAHVLEQHPVSFPVGPGLARTLTTVTPHGHRMRLTLPAPSATGEWSFAVRSRPGTELTWHSYALTSDATAPQLQADPPEAHTGHLVSHPEPPRRPGDAEGPTS
ncbi:hypothetical protein SUDANB19_06565 [Streptomyces sp. enrichment culture]